MEAKRHRPGGQGTPLSGHPGSRRPKQQPNNSAAKGAESKRITGASDALDAAATATAPAGPPRGRPAAHQVSSQRGAPRRAKSQRPSTGTHHAVRPAKRQPLEPSQHAPRGTPPEPSAWGPQRAPQSALPKGSCHQRQATLNQARGSPQRTPQSALPNGSCHQRHAPRPCEAPHAAGTHAAPQHEMIKRPTASAACPEPLSTLHALHGLGRQNLRFGAMPPLPNAQHAAGAGQACAWQQREWPTTTRETSPPEVRWQRRSGRQLARWACSAQAARAGRVGRSWTVGIKGESSLVGWILQTQSRRPQSLLSRKRERTCPP